MDRRSSQLIINKGIGQQGFDDHYAILGIPITASERQVRDKYLTIAKKLHPDVCRLSSDEKELANRYFARLVNPAYFSLNRTRELAEYLKVLKLLPKLMLKRFQRVSLQSEVAKQLARDPNKKNYEQAVNLVAQQQYENLTQVLDYAADLSELNLVYLLNAEGCLHLIEQPANSSPAQATQGNFGTIIANTVARELENNATTAVVQQHLQAAQSSIDRKQWAEALEDLHSAVKLDGQNSRCYALLGFVYMNQKFMGTAKASFEEALKLNPKEPLALHYLRKLNGEVRKKPEGSLPHKDNRSDKKTTKKGWFHFW